MNPEAAHRFGFVAILGYPNVGKSSLINALKGRGAAKTSSVSGFTKHIQKIRTSQIILLDTPGVIPYKENDRLKHNIIGTLDHNKEKNPDDVAMSLMEIFPGIIENYYNVDVNTEMGFRVLDEKYKKQRDYKKAIMAYNGLIRFKSGHYSQKYWKAFLKRRIAIDLVLGANN